MLSRGPGCSRTPPPTLRLVQLLKNRHFKTALFVSPVLALVSYVAVDHLVSERPAPAVSGRSYPLAEKPNCRYASGMCVLENGDVEIMIRAQRLSSGEVELSVSSPLPISSALVSAGSGETFSRPIALAGQGDLTARLKLSEPRKDTLRWAVTVLGAVYFAETPAVFVDREEALSRESLMAQPGSR